MRKIFCLYFNFFWKFCTYLRHVVSHDLELSLAQHLAAGQALGVIAVALVSQRQNGHSVTNKSDMLKACFYIAQYPHRWTAQNALHFAPLAGLFIPTPTRLLWEAQSHAAITCEDYSLTFPPPSLARYSFIQLSDLGHHGENENAQSSKL